MRKNFEHIIALIIGVALGAVGGILFAPDKGSNTRDILSYKLKKYREKLRELLKELVNSKAIVSSEAKEAGQHVISDAKDKAEKLLEEVDELFAQIDTNNKQANK
ncbi:MAG: YtxH domain-containing protein [Cytophagales bacterium]|nr:YtxH domain-containing protein [Cytophagales bacterium]